MITLSSDRTPGVFDTGVFRRNFLDEVRMSKGLAPHRDLPHVDDTDADHFPRLSWHSSRISIARDAFPCYRLSGNYLQLRGLLWVEAGVRA